MLHQRSSSLQRHSLSMLCGKRFSLNDLGLRPHLLLQLLTLLSLLFFLLRTLLCLLATLLFLLLLRALLFSLLARGRLETLALLGRVWAGIAHGNTIDATSPSPRITDDDKTESKRTDAT